MELCSIILPVFNSGVMLEDTLNSILIQSYQNYELIITNDCSKDNTIDIVNKFREKFGDKLKLFENSRNLGVGKTLTDITKKVNENSKYIFQIGQDDVWNYNYIETQISEVNRKDAIVSFSKVKYINENNKEIERKLFNHKAIKKYNNEELMLELLNGNFLCAPSSVINLKKITKNEIIKFWGYNNDRLQDYEMWLNLLMIGEFCFNQNTEISYRIHSNNYSSSEKRILQGKYEFYSTFTRVFLSEKFNNYLNNILDKEKFIINMITKLEKNIDYSKLLIIFIVNFLEYIYNNRIIGNSKTLEAKLAEYYNSLGFLTKTITTNGKLNEKLKVFMFNINKTSLIGSKFLEMDNIEAIFDDLKKVENKNFMIAIEEENLEFFLNDYNKVFEKIVKNRAIILVDSCNKKKCLKKYGNNLILDKSNINDFEKEIINYVEDKTDIYFNGFFTNYYKNNFNISKYTNEFIIDLQENFEVKVIKFYDKIIEVDKIIDLSTKQEINFISKNVNEYIIQTENINKIQIRLKKMLNIIDGVTINNSIYILDDIISYENNFIPKYRKFSFYMNSCSFKIIDDLEIKNAYLEYELHKIKNSRKYKLYIRIIGFLRKIFWFI